MYLEEIIMRLPTEQTSGTFGTRVRRGAMLLSLVAALCVMPLAAFAQKGTVVTRRVQFGRGRTTTVIKDRAAWGTTYRYYINARAGQSMSVHLTGVPDAVVEFYPPEAGTEPLEGADGVKDWSGTLPETGRYAIFVSHTRDGVKSAPYTLEITIR
jgi:hypothetical protein